MKTKYDSSTFVQIIADLKHQYRHDPRKWWLEYAFHYSDVRNVAKILCDGKLYSRNLLTKMGGMPNDNASPTIISNTEEHWKDYVRFYFRPKTPTQYHNEGIKPQHALTYGGAHCPVPVFLFFDLLGLITLEETHFSYENLATNPSIYHSAEDFRNMPFIHVYHEGPFDSFSDRHIVLHRHAELIIANECGLEHLKLVVCRSPAERETLINLLTDDVYAKWKDNIVVNPWGNPFYGEWVYFEEVTLSAESMIFQLHIGPRFKMIKQRGGFFAKVEIEDLKNGYKLYWKDENWIPEDIFTLTFSESVDEYEVKIFLDNHLSYYGVFKEDDGLPF